MTSLTRNGWSIWLALNVITSQLLYYILLSDLWEHSGVKEPKVNWPYLVMDKAAVSRFDFLAQLPELYRQVTAMAYLHQRV